MKNKAFKSSSEMFYLEVSLLLLISMWYIIMASN